MTPFEFELGQGTRACVVHLSGDVDIAVVPGLREQLDSVLDVGCADVVLDLTDVVYADSSALGLLVWLDHRLRPLGGRMLLAGANRDVSRILELSGLASVAESVGMSSNVAGALEALGLSRTVEEALWSEEVDEDLSPEMLAPTREKVCSLIAPLHLPEAALFDLKVALGEALANALRHGTPDSGPCRVKVVVTAYPDRVVIEVMDSGNGFDHEALKEAEVYDTSGRGVMFMRALADAVEFDRSPLGGTLVRLTKHRVGGLA